jgi:arylsulfatase A-like enzyme
MNVICTPLNTNANLCTGARYDPLIKVPLVIKYPTISSSTSGAAVASSSSSSQQMVNLIDVGPTILREVGLKADAKMEGVAISAAGEDENPIEGERMIYAEAGHVRASSTC